MDSGRPDEVTPSLRVAVHLDNGSLSLDHSAVRAAVKHVLTSEGVLSADVTVVLSNRDTVWRLNREFLNHDFATDVLTFPLSEQESLLEGEVYVDLDMAAARADEFGTTFQLESMRYIIHGILHLIGYLDDTISAKEQMRELEDGYLQHLGESS